MSKKRPGMTWQEHAEYGRALADFHNHVLNKLLNRYPIGSPQIRAWSRVDNALTQLRSVMDDAVFRDHPDCGKEGMYLYYPHGKERV